MNDIVRFPAVSRIHFIECPANGGMEWRAAQLNSLQFSHGMIGCAEWTGVKLSTLLDEVGLKKEAKWVMVEGADGAHMNRSLPLDKCLDDCLVVYAQNGEALRPDQGYPLRLVVPGWEGNVSVKWLRRDQARRQALVLARGNLEIHRPDAGRHLARLHLADRRQIGHHLSLPGKAARRVPASRNPGAGVDRQRQGQARRRFVDGGVNWQTARLHEPVLSKALTQIHAARGAGTAQPALLESRVIDETGYVQPTIAQLRKARGSEFGLSQQFDPDLAGQAGRKRLRCPARLGAACSALAAS